MTSRTPKLRPVDEPASTSPDPSERIQLTADRILVKVPDESERRSKGGLLIPATAAHTLRRCGWSEVVLSGPDVRNIRMADHVLFIPQTGLEVDVRGETFLLLRERDVQAIASDRIDPQAGQYL
jgi:chaperonin GroES